METRDNQQLVAGNLLKKAGIVLTDDHFVYTSGLHGTDYVAKDGLYADPQNLDAICALMASHLAKQEIAVVVGPAVGGVNLSQGVARHLNEQPRRIQLPKVAAAYAEREERTLAKHGDGKLAIVQSESIRLPEGAELVVKMPSFVLKRGYDLLVAGKPTIVVEDVLTTGGSARRTVDAVRKAGGIVEKVVAVCNRGQVKAEDLGVSELYSLTNPAFPSWTEDEMPDWLRERPVNVRYGHGKAYMERQAS